MTNADNAVITMPNKFRAFRAEQDGEWRTLLLAGEYKVKGIKPDPTFIDEQNCLVIEDKEGKEWYVSSESVANPQGALNKVRSNMPEIDKEFFQDGMNHGERN